MDKLEISHHSAFTKMEPNGTVNCNFNESNLSLRLCRCGNVASGNAGIVDDSPRKKKNHHNSFRGFAVQVLLVFTCVVQLFCYIATNKMDESSDKENFTPEVIVKEIRNGLYHIDLDFRLRPREIGVFEKIIQLYGAHSNCSYTIVYDDKGFKDEEGFCSGFIFIVKEMPCDDPSFTGTEMKTVNLCLIDDQEQPQTKRQKLCETSIVSKELEAKPSCSTNVWIKTNYKGAESSESSMLPMVKFGSNKWKMVVKNPRNPRNNCYRYRYSVTIFIDLGTPIRERNLIIFSNGLTEMFYNQHLCDVHFDFKDSQTVGAHVVILSAGSPVFFAMFRSEFVEAKTKKVIITDIDIEVFRQLLIYLYTGSAPKLAQENMTQLLFEAADKYIINNLKTECTDALLKRVNLDNAIRLLVWSHFHSVGNLKEATLKFLAANSLRIFSQPEWMDLIKNYPELCLLATQHMSKLLNKTNKTANNYYDYLF
jgi:hypothetical protein